MYQASPRSYPGRVPDIDYPSALKTRRVKHHGKFSWKSRHWYVGEALAGERVGLEEREEGHMDIYFGEYRIGLLNEAKEKVQPVKCMRKRDEDEG